MSLGLLFYLFLGFMYTLNVSRLGNLELCEHHYLVVHTANIPACWKAGGLGFREKRWLLEAPGGPEFSCTTARS